MADSCCTRITRRSQVNCSKNAGDTKIAFGSANSSNANWRRYVRGFIDGEYQDGELRGLTFVAGQRGMGKTTEVVRLLDQCAGGCLIFDPLGTHGPLCRGYVTVSQPGPLKEYLRVNRNRRFRIRYEPRDVHVPEHFNAVCSIVQAFGTMIFAADEVDMFCGEGKQGMPQPLYDLAHYGRHFKVSMLVTARDPATLGIRFRSQCAFLRLFRMDEDRYIKYFAGRIGNANAERLRTLERFQYLLWESGTSGVRVCGGRRSL